MSKFFQQMLNEEKEEHHIREMKRLRAALKENSERAAKLPPAKGPRIGAFNVQDEPKELDALNLLIPLVNGTYAVHGLPVARILEMYPEFEVDPTEAILLSESMTRQLYKSLKEIYEPELKQSEWPAHPPAPAPGERDEW